MSDAPPTTRSLLLEAAAEVSLQRGFAATSMDFVRQWARVSNGSLYHHFPTKAHLAAALYAHTLRDLHAALLVPISGRASAERGVKGLVRAFVQWVEAHPDRARLLHELRKDVENETEIDAANAEAFAALAAWVREHAGELQPLSLSVWLALVFAPLVALTPRWTAPGAKPIDAKTRLALEHAAWRAVGKDTP